MPSSKKPIVVPMVQTLFFERYPFRYKSVFEWVIKNGALRLQLVTYPNKWVTTLSKLLPLLITLNVTILHFLCLIYLSLEEGIVLYKDFRYWLWFCLFVVSLSEVLGYYAVAFGAQSASIPHLLDETIALEKEVWEGEQIQTQKSRNSFILIISASQGIQVDSIPHSHNLETLLNIVQFITRVAFYVTPPVLMLGMVLDLDPFAFVLPQILGPSTFVGPVTRCLLSYSFGVFHAYEMVRIFFFNTAVLIYVFQLVASGMGLARVIRPSRGNIFYILKWIRVYRKVQIAVGIFRPLLVRGVLFTLLNIMVFIIIMLYVLIRLHRALDQVTLFIFLVALVIISSVTKICWEFAAEIHGQTVDLLEKFASAEGICSFASGWDRNTVSEVGLPEVGLNLYKAKRMIKLYNRMVRALQPIGIPLGFRGTTFFLATRSTKSESYRLLADWTLNVLLVYVQIKKAGVKIRRLNGKCHRCISY